MRKFVKPKILKVSVLCSVIVGFFYVLTKQRSEYMPGNKNSECDQQCKQFKPVAKSNSLVHQPRSAMHVTHDTVEHIPGNMILDCDQECKKLTHLINNNWPANKPRAAIYVLTQSIRLRSLQIWLKSVYKYFNKIYHYPVIIFHEADLISFIPKIRGFSQNSLYFQLVNLSLPSFLTKAVKRNIPCVSTIGYRHMCRFQAKLVYKMPILQDLDYYWRFDDDSKLTKPVIYDVFKFMQQHSYLYGYVWEHNDAYKCVTGLWEATSQYIEMHDIQTQFFLNWPSPKLYYNNFEVSSSKIWLSTHYTKYIDYIDDLGGIYYFRWGDAPIKGIAVSMFVPLNSTHLFRDIGYEHGSFKTNT